MPRVSELELVRRPRCARALAQLGPKSRRRSRRTGLISLASLFPQRRSQPLPHQYVPTTASCSLRRPPLATTAAPERARLRNTDRRLEHDDPSARGDSRYQHGEARLGFTGGGNSCAHALAVRWRRDDARRSVSRAS